MHTEVKGVEKSGKVRKEGWNSEEKGRREKRNSFHLCFHWRLEDAFCGTYETHKNSASQTIFAASKVLKAPSHIFKLSTLISLRGH